MLASLLTLFIFGTLVTGGMVFLLRRFAVRTKEGSSSDMNDQETQVKAIDLEIQAALDYMAPMIPLGEAVQREQEIATIRSELAVESKKLADLDLVPPELRELVLRTEAVQRFPLELRELLPFRE